METEAKLSQSTSISVSGERVPLEKIPQVRKGGKGGIILWGWRKVLTELRIRWSIMGIIIQCSGNPIQWIHLARALDRNRRRFSGESRIKKVARAGGAFHWDLYIPGSPSPAFRHFIAGEVNRLSRPGQAQNHLTTVFIGFTKKCSLQCEHCYEWDSLNGREKLTLPDIKRIVQKFQERGVTQILISGGEPMLRLDDLVEVLRCAEKKTEFWLLTSGFKLTGENAEKLKDAGLKGVVVSLDHFDPEKHNAFRGLHTSFDWAEKAIVNANAVKLVSAVSICVTREFVSETNLMAYADLARQWGVSFVQILEPRAVGHYKGKDVDLEPDHVRMLEDFYWKMNFDKKYRDYPIVNYHAQYQRKVGCVGSGNRNLYVDTDGDLHACPFCQTKCGNALSPDLDLAIENLRTRGCHIYDSTPL